MKKLLLGCTFLLGMGLQAMWAVPARRGITKEFTQPDGTTIAVKVVGDEHAHIYLTDDGLPLLTDSDGYMCYATVGADGTPAASRYVAREASARSAAEKSFVARINPDAVSEAIFNGALASSRISATPMRRANQSGGIGLDEGDALFPHMGEPHAMVILVEYRDVKLYTPDAGTYYQEFLNKEGFSRDNGTGSCRDYFIASSHGQFRPTFDLYGPVTLPQNQAYYGGNDVWGNDLNPEKMVVDAVRLLDPDVDFTKYDTDGDGRVDNIYIIYAGQGENSYGSESTVWPHRWSLSSAQVTLEADGKIIDDYGCCNEYDDFAPTGIGTFCHEFGHVMGLPDLYSTTYNDARYSTPGDWSVMDHGSYNNDGRTPPSYSIYERNAMGWIDPVVLDSPAHIELDNIHDSNTGAIVLTDNKNEFFLFENRQQTGWDTYLPGHGMLVWHIDYRAAIWDVNKVNNTKNHQYVDIEEASGYADNSSKDYMAAYPFPGINRVTSFTDDTTPSMRTWLGAKMNTPITNITETGGKIHFDVCGGEPIDAPAALRYSDINPGGFTLSWDAVDNARSYLVDVFTRAADGTAFPAGRFEAFETQGTTCVIDRLDGATTYTCTVRSTNGSNISLPSAEINVTTDDPVFEYAVPRVSAPTNLDATTFTANWLPVNEATDYMLTVSVVCKSNPATETCGFGVGNSLRLPEGWTSSTAKYYGTISKNYWITAPALQMTVNGDFVMTPLYSSELLSFKTWIRSASDAITNAVEVEVRTDEKADWKLLLYRDHLANGKEGEWITVTDIPAGMHQLRFNYLKPDHAGNLAVDDMSVETGDITTRILSGYDATPTGNTTSMQVTGLPADAIEISYYVVARKADGTMSLPSDPAHVKLGENSGIDDILTAGTDSRVTVADGMIHIDAPVGTHVAVTDLSGRVIATATVGEGGSARIAAATGFAIVRVGSDTHKVIVK